MESEKKITKKEKYKAGAVRPIQVWPDCNAPHNAYLALCHLAKIDKRSLSNYCTKVLEEHARINASSFLNK